MAFHQEHVKLETVFGLYLLKHSRSKLKIRIMTPANGASGSWTRILLTSFDYQGVILPCFWKASSTWFVISDCSCVANILNYLQKFGEKAENFSSVPDDRNIDAQRTSVVALINIDN